MDGGSFRLRSRRNHTSGGVVTVAGIRQVSEVTERLCEGTSISELSLTGDILQSLHHNTPRIEKRSKVGRLKMHLTAGM